MRYLRYLHVEMGMCVGPRCHYPTKPSEPQLVGRAQGSARHGMVVRHLIAQSLVLDELVYADVLDLYEIAWARCFRNLWRVFAQLGQVSRGCMSDVSSCCQHASGYLRRSAQTWSLPF